MTSFVDRVLEITQNIQHFIEKNSEKLLELGDRAGCDSELIPLVPSSALDPVIREYKKRFIDRSSSIQEHNNAIQYCLKFIRLRVPSAMEIDSISSSKLLPTIETKLNPPVDVPSQNLQPTQAPAQSYQWTIQPDFSNTLPTQMYYGPSTSPSFIMRPPPWFNQKGSQMATCFFPLPSMLQNRAANLNTSGVPTPTSEEFKATDLKLNKPEQKSQSRPASPGSVFDRQLEQHNAIVESKTVRIKSNEEFEQLPAIITNEISTASSSEETIIIDDLKDEETISDVAGPSRSTEKEKPNENGTLTLIFRNSDMPAKKRKREDKRSEADCSFDKASYGNGQTKIMKLSEDNGSMVIDLSQPEQHEAPTIDLTYENGSYKGPEYVTSIRSTSHSQQPKSTIDLTTDNNSATTENATEVSNVDSANGKAAENIKVVNYFTIRSSSIEQSSATQAAQLVCNEGSTGSQITATASTTSKPLRFDLDMVGILKKLSPNHVPVSSNGPGTSGISIKIPKKKDRTVLFSEILDEHLFKDSNNLKKNKHLLQRLIAELEKEADEKAKKTAMNVENNFANTDRKFKESEELRAKLKSVLRNIKQTPNQSKSWLKELKDLNEMMKQHRRTRVMSSTVQMTQGLEEEWDFDNDEACEDRCETLELEVNKSKLAVYNGTDFKEFNFFISKVLQGTVSSDDTLLGTLRTLNVKHAYNLSETKINAIIEETLHDIARHKWLCVIEGCSSKYRNLGDIDLEDPELNLMLARNKVDSEANVEERFNRLAALAEANIDPGEYENLSNSSDDSSNSSM